MKKIFSLILAFLLVLSLAACGSSSDPAPAGSSSEDSAAELETHKIAVMVYDRGDDEVISFRKYLAEYIGPAFNVEFIYSEGVLTEEDAQEFITTASEYGAEGVMSFITVDLQSEVELCEQLGLYYIVASGTVSNEDFASVEDSSAFLGMIGPGSFIEYKAGADMVNHFLSRNPESTEYFILSGGGCVGNEMHMQRTMGILDTLQNAYGVSYGQTTEELACAAEPVNIESGDLKICICPGYHTNEENLETAKKEYADHLYQNVLAVLPATHMLDEIKGADLATVDCYSETNLQLFVNGRLNYLVGKYSSIIGPSFAAMYNAVTGHADMLRMNGKAFSITQGFWVSDGEEDYSEKYILASSVEMNAYNYEDLQKVICLFNPNATLDDLKALAEAYTFKDAVERRTR